MTEVDAQAPAVVSDLEGDGRVDIVASSDWDFDGVTNIYKMRGTLYAWELASTFGQAEMPWPTFHRDVQRTGLYGGVVIPPRQKWSRISQDSAEFIHQAVQYVPRLSAPPAIYGIGSDQNIHKWDGTSWSAVTTGGEVKNDFHVISDRHIYAIKTDNKIWHWNGAKWERLSNDPTEFIHQALVYKSPSEIYGIGSDQNIHKWDGTRWRRISNGKNVKDDFVVVSEKDIYAIGNDGQVWHWNGTTSRWDDAPATSGGQIKGKLHVVLPVSPASGLANFYGMRDDHKIWKWEGDSFRWVSLTGCCVKDNFYFISEDQIYAIGTTQAQIENKIVRWGLTETIQKPLPALTYSKTPNGPRETKFRACEDIHGKAEEVGANGMMCAEVVAHPNVPSAVNPALCANPPANYVRTDSLKEWIPPQGSFDASTSSWRGLTKWQDFFPSIVAPGVKLKIHLYDPQTGEKAEPAPVDYIAC